MVGVSGRTQQTMDRLLSFMIDLLMGTASKVSAGLATFTGSCQDLKWGTTA
jgi:hypothetical protein